jgi:hypothetical protein
VSDESVLGEGSSREQRVVITRAYDHFHATGVWPTFGQLDRPLYNEEQIEVLSVLRSSRVHADDRVELIPLSMEVGETLWCRVSPIRVGGPTCTISEWRVEPWAPIGGR